MDRYLDEDMPEWLLDFVLSGMPNMTERDRQLHADLQTVMRHRRSNGGQASRLTPQYGTSRMDAARRLKLLRYRQIIQIIDALPKLSEDDVSRLNQRGVFNPS